MSPQRQAFGKPLSAFQGVSHPLADFDTQVEAARLLCLQALWLKDKGAPHSAEAAMCKWWAPKLAYDVDPPMPAHARPRRLRPRADGAAAARRARLPDRRRHGADHEDHHRARPRRPRARFRPDSDAETSERGEETWNSTPFFWPPRRADSVARGFWRDRTINDDLDACVAVMPGQARADRGSARRRRDPPLHLPRARDARRPHRGRPVAARRRPQRRRRHAAAELVAVHRCSISPARASARCSIR